MNASCISAPTTQQRAAALIDTGYRPVPVLGKQIAYAGDSAERDYAPEHFTDGTRIQIRAGLQKDGTFLCAGDLEGPSHGPQFDAEAERAALESALPSVARKLVWARSTTGDGWWPIFRTYAKLTSGQLYRDGRKIGDFIGVGGTQRVPDFGDALLQVLTKTEVDLLLQFWTVHSSDRSDSERWSARAAEGKRYTAGWKREQVPDLATWLRAVKVSDKAAPFRDELLAKLDTATRGERSTLAGRLARFILNHIH